MFPLRRNWQVPQVSALNHFRDFTVHLCVKKKSNVILSSAFYNYIDIHACKTIVQKRDISRKQLKERKTMHRNYTLPLWKIICNRTANLSKEHGGIRKHLNLTQWPYTNKTRAPVIQINCWIPNGSMETIVIIICCCSSRTDTLLLYTVVSAGTEAHWSCASS